MKKIPFNKPFHISGLDFLSQKDHLHLSGDGPFTQKCTSWFQEHLGSACLLTTSCTHALEMAALLLDIREGDEIIMPSYTFVSTANAFVLQGAKIIFVDIRPDTMNIDEKLIEAAISPKTKAIVPVHYGGVSCEMGTIKGIADKYNLYVVEDAAQGMMSTYRGKPLGTLSDIGTYSFHETKNYTSGEGGLLIIGNESLSEDAEIIREKGTNRSLFFRGMVDKYTWVSRGSSYLPSELNAAYLWPQLTQGKAQIINKKRLKLWNRYKENLGSLIASSTIEIQNIPDHCTSNGHLFYIKLKNLETRGQLISYLKERDIQTAFHYIPLHSSPFGEKHTEFFGKDQYTTIESERLLRLPLFYELSITDVDYICEYIHSFFKDR
jgi:dTDP-4-amino-4,6-dideoxygalactose transaminase